MKHKEIYLIGVSIIIMFLMVVILLSLSKSSFDEGCNKDFPYKTICGKGTEYEAECCCSHKERWYSYDNLFNVGEKLRTVGGMCV